jgi:NAD(P)-dependent dehydrogenase (short-subunit alcohol dehydrogenase family)
MLRSLAANEVRMPDSQSSVKQVVLITGAFGALGSALAKRFLSKGAFVIALGSQHRAPSGPTPSLVFNPDLSNPLEVRATLEQVASQVDHLDVLINAAGGFGLDALDKPMLDVWDEMYSRNLKTVVCMCKASISLLKKSAAGRIINIAAASALGPATLSNAAYVTSKLGVIKFTEGLAHELSADGITANAILPTTIDTPANRASMPKADFSKWVTMDQLADAIELLTSQRGQVVSGAAIRVGR